MAKYDNQIAELKNLLPNAKNILIALPVGVDIDKFAAGLALFLAFEQQGKQVQIVSEDTIRVAQANLFGVDHIKNTISSGSGGDLTIVLEGVVSNGSVPALEKLDWFPEGSNLNLVFHTLPGQTFKPANITPKYGASGGFDIIFTIGAASLDALGSIYSTNSQAFSGHIVNIDSQAGNTNFGRINIVDSNTSSISEIMTDLIPSLSLPFDSDIASNLLAGIFDATANLSNQKVGADTYLAVASCLRVGGRKPTNSNSAPAQNTGTTSFNQPSQGLDLSALFPSQPPSQPEEIPTQSFTVPPAVTQNSQLQPIPSAEERPQREGLNSADSIEVEPGWLTPKVFKGTSVG